MIWKDLSVIIVVTLISVISIGLQFANKSKLKTKWNYILWIPLIACMIHYLCSSKNLFMFLVYAGVILLAVDYFIRKKKILSILLAVLASVLALAPVVLTIKTSSNCYASLNYVDSFCRFHKDMKENYALQGWKETDFDAIYDAYYPMFVQAQKDHDKLAYTTALRAYMSAYQDGHVQLWDMYENFGIGSTRNLQNANKENLPNYYGMSLLQLDSGEYVAVNIEEGGSANQAGITQGMEITKWDGVTIDELANQIDHLDLIHCCMFADQENLNRMKPFYIACTGGEQVQVSYLDINGMEQTVTLTSMGNGYEYLYTTIGKFLHVDYHANASEDISYQTMADYIGYLKVTGMGSDYDAIKAQMEQYIKTMEDDQVTSMIIDVRDNCGGDDMAGAILTEYFAKEDMVYLKETTYDRESKQYKVNRTINVKAKNRIDLPVMILVNSQCISAGEGFVYNMAKLSNVTVIGITGTNGSFGTIVGVDVMPEGMMAVYPAIACVDENGVVMIDSKKDGIGGIKPEIRIPVNEEAVPRIFEEEQDYELEYTIQEILHRS